MTNDPQTEVAYLLFDVGTETFGVPATRVGEILEIPDLTRVPTLPPCVRGVMNLRGTVIPVIDLGVRFGGAPMAVTARTAVIVMETDQAVGTLWLGLMTGRIHDVVSVPPGEVHAVAAPTAGVDLDVDDYVSGRIDFHQHSAMLLDCQRTLSVDALLATRARAPSQEHA